jgi:hypothetical protein
MMNPERKTHNMSVETGRAETLEATSSVTLPYAVGTLNGLYAVLVHAAKDNKTPVIATVRVDSRAFVATDRYTVGRWTHSDQNELSTDSPNILVPRSAAEWLTKQLPKAIGKTESELADPDSGRPTATITFTPESITVLSDAGDILAVTRFEPITGNFPPVEKLLGRIEFATDARPIALDPKHLDKFSKGAVRAASRDAAITMEFDSEPSGKTGRAYITFGEHFDGLMQLSTVRGSR